MDETTVKYARTSDGYDIAYTDRGEGTPLVVIPPPLSHVGLLYRAQAAVYARDHGLV